jgi:hypothetical protein
MSEGIFGELEREIERQILEEAPHVKDKEIQSFEWQDTIGQHSRLLTVSNRKLEGEQYQVVRASDYRQRLIIIAAIAISAVMAEDEK